VRHVVACMSDTAVRVAVCVAVCVAECVALSRFSTNEYMWHNEELSAICYCMYQSIIGLFLAYIGLF